jgi:hypothetical protein
VFVLYIGIFSLSEKYLLRLFHFKTKCYNQNLWERRIGIIYRKLPLRDWYFPTNTVKLFLTLKLCQTIHSPIALQPFVGPWPLFHLGNLTRSRYDCLDVVSGRYLHTGQHKNRINIDIRTSTPSVGFESTTPVFERVKSVHTQTARPPKLACQTAIWHTLDAIPAFSWRNWGQPQRTSVRMVGGPVGVRSGHLPNVSQEGYRFC